MSVQELPGNCDAGVVECELFMQTSSSVLLVRDLALDMAGRYLCMVVEYLVEKGVGEG